jgi:hypothetical protein
LLARFLATVYYAGWHHLVEAEDWPHKLPAGVHGAVPPRPPGINDAQPAERCAREL